MKDQYFGDINDYKKYGLLRILSGNGAMKIAVCWMLTDSDGRTDGSKIGYLGKPDQWRKFDPELFNALQHAVRTNQRETVHAERFTIIPSASYYTHLLSDESESRREYFTKFFASASGSDLIFFDPDNGLEVESVTYGKRGSSKYLYWNELIRTFEAGYSILLYQHFPRVKRDIFRKQLRAQILKSLGATEILFFQTSNVLFILIPQKNRSEYFRTRITEIERSWNSGNKTLFSTYR